MFREESQLIGPILSVIRWEVFKLKVKTTQAEVLLYCKMQFGLEVFILKSSQADWNLQPGVLNLVVKWGIIV